MSRLFLLGICVLVTTGCSEEARSSGPDLPQTPPRNAQDPRAAAYERNVYQVAQGGRYFTWYGCGECHGGNARGALNLGDTAWTHGGNLDQVFSYIAHGHRGALARYGDRIPAEQLWQITAYVRNLPLLQPEKRRRQDLDQIAEPQGERWAGPLR